MFLVHVQQMPEIAKEAMEVTWKYFYIEIYCSLMVAHFNSITENLANCRFQCQWTLWTNSYCIFRIFLLFCLGSHLSSTSEYRNIKKYENILYTLFTLFSAVLPESILHIYKTIIHTCFEYCCHILSGAPDRYSC